MEKAANKAIGLLVGLYRRIADLTQKDLAKHSGVDVSKIAMVESGLRALGTDRHALAEALKISALGKEELDVLANGWFGIPQADFLTPEDVLTGTPLFVRGLSEEFSNQRTNFDAVWIVTSGDLLRNPALQSFIEQRVKKTRFVFFIASDSLSLDSIILLRNRIIKECRVSKKCLDQNLLLIKVPPAVCLQDMVIYDPGKSCCMFGRIIIRLQFPCGTFAMDPSQLIRVYNAFGLILMQVETRPGVHVETSAGGSMLLPSA